MSYDIEIWSVHPLTSTLLEGDDSWGKVGGGFLRSGRGWQIVVNISARILPEDIPESIAPALPGIEFVTRVNLEGNASPAARGHLDSIAKRLAKALYGTIFDPQKDLVTTPNGVSRIAKTGRPETFSILQLSWWFLDSSVCEADGLDKLLKCFETTLPEAVPRRYGLWEPPQHFYAETGRAHFLRFLNENVSLVWYPSRPIVGVHLGRPSPLGPGRRGFRANHLSISIELGALEQPGWNAQLHRAWLDISRLICPFYSDVHVMNGYRRGGAGGYGLGRGTEQHPVKSWWWRGIPQDVGSAVLVGKEYRELWPSLDATGERIDELSFLTSPDWSTKTNVAERVGGVPTDLADPTREPTAGSLEGINAPFNSKESYPITWPFGEPFKDQKEDS